MRPKLTARQQELLHYIEQVVSTTGYRRVSARSGQPWGLAPPTAYAHPQGAGKKGYIQRSLRTSRGIAMLDRIKRVATTAVRDAVDIPVLGRVTAGPRSSL